MDLQMRGKRALVTGSTAGIGLAAAAGLSREGASVVINGRTPQRVEEAVRKIRDGGGGEVSGIAADLSTAEGVAELLRQLPEVDILVNNLGIFEPKPFEEIPDADWLATTCRRCVGRIGAASSSSPASRRCRSRRR
jgi:NAD(P)-dependent dehydrogenase (short-subunit alcohol dehydrogenase family)